MNAQLPEELYFGPDDSVSDLSFYGVSFTPSYDQENSYRTVTTLVKKIALVEQPRRELEGEEKHAAEAGREIV